MDENTRAEKLSSLNEPVGEPAPVALTTSSSQATSPPSSMQQGASLVSTTKQGTKQTSTLDNTPRWKQRCNQFWQAIHNHLPKQLGSSQRAMFALGIVLLLVSVLLAYGLYSSFQREVQAHVQEHKGTAFWSNEAYFRITEVEVTQDEGLSFTLINTLLKRVRIENITVGLENGTLHTLEQAQFSLDPSEEVVIKEEEFVCAQTTTYSLSFSMHYTDESAGSSYTYTGLGRSIEGSCT